MYQKSEYLQLLFDTCQHLYRFPKPIIASVHGYALGIGAEMCVNCDFILIGETAEIGFPEVPMATMVGGGATKTLPRLVGLARARELIMTGERVNGTKAAAIGLATRCVPDAALWNETLAFAQRLAKLPPVSLALAKSMLNADASYDDMLALERGAVLTCMLTEDWQEGVDSFAEKREPVYKGR
jgi:enoyl-CoA hydratase